MMDSLTCHFYRIERNGKTLMKKQLRDELLSNEQYRLVMRKEYEIGKEVGENTTYVVTYQEFIDTPEECAIIMDFIEGQTLGQILTYSPDYFRNKKNRLRFIRQFLEGIDIIHKHQAVHLDLKPTNIMITHVNHDVRIVDMGFSYADSYQSTMGLTYSFAAPEQLDGSQDVDARTDIYAVGKILKLIGVKDKKIINKCLHLDKSQRWQSAEEMLTYVNSDRGRRIRNITLLALAVIAVVAGVWTIEDYRHNNFTVADFKYEILSEDSQHVALVGRVDKPSTSSFNIASKVEHDGKYYTVVEIGDSAFCGDSILESVSIPHTLKRIGRAAFCDSHNLCSVDIPNNTEDVLERAFYNCLSLKEIRLSGNLRTIRSGMFAKNITLESISIPEGIKTIETDAFGHCHVLRNVSLPQSLEIISRGVFFACYSLTTITIPQNVKEIGVYAFMECPSLTTVYNYAKTPQRCIDIFLNDTQHIILYVPKESVELYKKAKCWGDLDVRPMPL